MNSINNSKSREHRGLLKYKCEIKVQPIYTK